MPQARVRRPFLASLLMAALCGAALLAASAPVRAADVQGVLTLLNGNAVAGRFVPAPSPEVIRWQASDFVRPFDFVAGSVASVRFPPSEPAVKAKGEFTIELAKEDVLTGRLVRWSDELVEIDTERFGTLHVRREAVRRFVRIDGNPALVYTGLTGLTGWRDSGSAWREDGTQLVSDAPQSTIAADVGLPEKALIEFELSWKKSSAFVLAVGVDPEGKTDKRQEGWRFETWDGTLALVREQPLSADVDKVASLSAEAGRVHLIAYLDQASGTMQVFLPDGTAAGKVTVASELDAAASAKAKPARGIRLINRRGELRLEKLRVSRWNGLLPALKKAGQSHLDLADGKTVSGTIAGFDDTARAFVVRDGEQETRVPLETVVSADVSTGFGGGMRSASVALQDGSRISGRLEAIDAEGLAIACPEIDEPLRVPYSQFRGFNNLQPKPPEEPNKPEGRSGRIELAGLRLHGRLIPSVEGPNGSAIAWRPDSSLTGSPLRPDAAGRIVFRDPPPPQPKNVIRQRAVNQPQPKKVFLGPAGNKPAADPKAATHTLHLRSGDNIPCTVVSMDEEGVRVATRGNDSRVVPHSLIKAVELRTGAPHPSLREAKKQRLLTLPRLQKASPPTHLLCSNTGDFLRVRILTMDAERLRVEMHLSEIEIPRERISQIVWFHPDELAATEDTKTDGKKPAAKPEQGISGGPVGDAPLVGSPAENVAALEGDAAVAEMPQADETSRSHLIQLLWTDGRRVTFDPSEVDGQDVVGTSEVLGPCRFRIDEFDQLIFGRQIGLAAGQLVWNQWRLRNAVEPLVAQDLANDPGVAGPESSLVGKPAPEIELALLDGEPFKLSACKGRIVVLDFWASWCGPCMRTMPLVEEAVAGFDEKRVRLVSINLEESAAQVQATLERQKLHVAVALDVDGIAARRYEANAIPQLVIVDAEGKVARLYVGGGPQVVERLKESIGELLKDPADKEAKPAAP